MIGLGLLEAIPAAHILANADPDDADGDGISGRPSIVWSRRFERPMLGRFGPKAGAFAGDMGLSTPLMPADICGVARAERGFVATDGLGRTTHIRPDGAETVSGDAEGRAWDNHLVAL